MKLEEVTYQEMCKKINEAGVLRDRNGNNPTPEQIFNYSASGELFMIHEWYRIALHALDFIENNKEPSSN